MASKQIKPGQWINVKITSVPKAAKNRKTMIRLFEKDENVHAERKRLNRARPFVTRTRGGRPWECRPQRLDVVEIKPGVTYKVFASVDVLRELQSVEKFVDVKVAKK